MNNKIKYTIGVIAIVIISFVIYQTSRSENRNTGPINDFPFLVNELVYENKDLGISFSYPEEIRGTNTEKKPAFDENNNLILFRYYKKSGDPISGKGGQTSEREYGTTLKMTINNLEGTNFTFGASLDGSGGYTYNPINNNWFSRDNRTKQYSWEELYDEITLPETDDLSDLSSVLETNSGQKAISYKQGLYGGETHGFRIFDEENRRIIDFRQEVDEFPAELRDELQEIVYVTNDVMLGIVSKMNISTHISNSSTPSTEKRYSIGQFDEWLTHHNNTYDYRIKYPNSMYVWDDSDDRIVFSVLEEVPISKGDYSTFTIWVNDSNECSFADRPRQLVDFGNIKAYRYDTGQSRHYELQISDTNKLKQWGSGCHHVQLHVNRLGDAPTQLNDWKILEQMVDSFELIFG